MTFTTIRVIMASIWISSAFKWGDWRNWKRYYPTMLFFGMGDLIYNFIFFNKPLWRFQTDFLSLSLNELFVIFTIFFSTTLIFLSKYPENIFRRVIYIALWVALYMVIEVFTTSIKMHKNYNGWNIWWSLFHNSIQFPLLALHHKNPILAWIIAFIFLVAIMSIFDVPFIIST
jgi:hypothetical protein